jgi:hypothetical protein
MCYDGRVEIRCKRVLDTISGSKAWHGVVGWHNLLYARLVVLVRKLVLCVRGVNWLALSQVSRLPSLLPDRVADRYSSPILHTCISTVLPFLQ